MSGRPQSGCAGAADHPDSRFFSLRTSAPRASRHSGARTGTRSSPAAQPACPSRSTSKAALPGTVVLFTVQIRHSFYNLQDKRCPDFTVVPTPDCAGLANRLGIFIQVAADGFRVCAPQSRIPAITDAIRRGATGGQGCWTRLTYCLVLRNPAFYGFTALPLETSPTSQGLYASNLQTTTVRGDLLFGGRNGLGAGALVPVTGATLSFQAPAGTTVTASDIAGQPVRSVTVAAGQPSELSLSGLPCDVYTITADPADAYAGPSRVLYTPARPLSAGLMDLLLAQPEDGAGSPAAFPFGPLPDAAADRATPTVQPVTITLSFEARRTIWKYYVVALSPNGRRAGDLSITGEGATFKQASAPVTLPNGETATLFQSTGTLELRQGSPFRFALSGQSQGSDGSRDRVSINPLPVAPAHPVWPASTGNGLSGTSEIFVYV